MRRVGGGAEGAGVEASQGYRPPMFQRKSSKSKLAFGTGELLLPERVVRLQAEAPGREEEAETQWQ